MMKNMMELFTRPDPPRARQEPPKAKQESPRARQPEVVAFHFFKVGRCSRTHTYIHIHVYTHPKHTDY